MAKKAPSKKKNKNMKAAKVDAAISLALPVGTVIQKRDRHGKVRCECTVEADGYRYGKMVYRSLSAAAVAAAKDLGLVAKSLNGLVFWGLKKPLGKNPIERTEQLFKRYSEAAQQLARDPEQKAGFLDHARQHLKQMQELVG